MSCAITSNSFSEWDPCQFFSGGIQRLWVANWEQDLRSRLVYDNVTNNVIDVTAGKIVVELPRPSLDNVRANYVEEYNNDTKNYTIKLNFEVIGWEQDKRSAVDSLAKGEYIFAWLDYNGRYWLSFFEKPGECEEATFSTGQKAQQQDYAFTFTAKQSQPAVQIGRVFLENCDCDNLDQSTDDIMALSGSCIYVSSYLSCPVAGILDVAF